MHVPRGVEPLQSDPSKISGDNHACWPQQDPVVKEGIRPLQAVKDFLPARAHQRAEVFIVAER